MAKPKITYTCKRCGAQFSPPRSGRAASYCSQPCYHAGFPVERFWANVNRTETCWLWTGPTDEDGYGKSGKERAHRRAWRMTYGPLAKGEQVLHRCDTPPCVRPDHLFKGSNAQNVADMVAKGRSPWGSRHPNALVTDAMVRQARIDYAEGRGTYRSLGLRLGLSSSGAHAAITGKTWRHLH